MPLSFELLVIDMGWYYNNIATIEVVIITRTRNFT